MISHSQKAPQSSSEPVVVATNLPVLIAGAGPCGLVAALTLQRQNVPFIVIERATREKLCANVGSGYDLAPTALEILERRLGLEINAIFSEYSGMCFQDIKGKRIRDIKKPSAASLKFGSVNRAELQHLLLSTIFPSSKNEDGVLCCGAGIQSYTTTHDVPQESGSLATIVTATLSDGSEIQGRALLGCDGIHSAVRKQMHRSQRDDLNFCNITCYWGKCKVLPASEFDQALQATQTYASHGSSIVVAMGSRKYPGSFFWLRVRAKCYGRFRLRLILHQENVQMI